MKTIPTKHVRHTDIALKPSADTRTARLASAKSSLADPSVFKVTPDIQRRVREFVTNIELEGRKYKSTKLAVLEAVKSICFANVSLQDAAKMSGFDPYRLHLLLRRLATGTTQEALKYFLRSNPKDFVQRHYFAGAEGSPHPLKSLHPKGTSQSEQLRSATATHIAMQPAGANTPGILSGVRSPVLNQRPDFDSVAFEDTFAIDDWHLSPLLDSFIAYEHFAAVASDPEARRPSTPPPPEPAAPAAVAKKHVRWASDVVSPVSSRPQRAATASEIVARAMKDVAAPIFASQADYDAFLGSESGSDTPASPSPQPVPAPFIIPSSTPAQLAIAMHSRPAHDLATAMPVLDPVSGPELMASPPPSARVYYVTPSMIQAAHNEFLHISQLSARRVSPGKLSAFYALTEMCQGGHLFEVGVRYGLKHSFVHDVVTALHTTSPLDVFFWLTLNPQGSAETPPGPQARLILQQEELAREPGVPAMWEPLMAPAMVFDAHPLGVTDAPHAAWTGSLMGAQMPFGQTAHAYWHV